jgi:hypothetical protein
MEIITAMAATITALGVIFGAIFAIYKWYLKQEKQDKDISAIKQEQAILTEGILACLQGLREQGCNGPVTAAITKIEAYINAKAHEQDNKK